MTYISIKKKKKAGALPEDLMRLNAGSSVYIWASESSSKSGDHKGTHLTGDLWGCNAFGAANVTGIIYVGFD